MMTPQHNASLSRHEGERRKLEAHALLASRREVFVNRGRRALLKSLLIAGTATADDVRLGVELPEGISPKCFGVVPGPLAQAGLIRRAGFAKTTRPEAHARPVTVWELIDRASALRWLATHPDRHPTPPEADDLLGGLTETKNADALTPANDKKGLR